MGASKLATLAVSFVLSVLVMVVIGMGWPLALAVAWIIHRVYALVRSRRVGDSRGIGRSVSLYFVNMARVAERAAFVRG
jgi:hypothetical protein